MNFTQNQILKMNVSVGIQWLGMRQIQKIVVFGRTESYRIPSHCFL